MYFILRKQERLRRGGGRNITGGGAYNRMIFFCFQVGGSAAQCLGRLP